MVIGTSFAIMKAKAEVAKSNFSAVQISTSGTHRLMTKRENVIHRAELY